MFCSFSEGHECLYLECTHEKMKNSDLYPGVLTERNDNSGLLKASTKLALFFKCIKRQMDLKLGLNTRSGCKPQAENMLLMTGQVK